MLIRIALTSLTVYAGLAVAVIIYAVFLDWALGPEPYLTAAAVCGALAWFNTKPKLSLRSTRDIARLEG